MFDPLHKWLGIPPSEQPPNDYRLLGLSDFEADPEVIDAAADRDLTFLHDLTNGEHGDLAEELSNRISAARIRLLNKKKKAAYDAELRANVTEEDIDIDSVIASLGPREQSEQPKASDDLVVRRASEVLGMPPGISSPAPTTAARPTPTADHADRSDTNRSNTSPAENSRPAGPLVDARSPRARKRRKPALMVWALGVLPSLTILAWLIYSIGTGRLQLDRNKLEKIGVPPEQAAQLAGESGKPAEDSVIVAEPNPPAQASQSKSASPQAGENATATKRSDAATASSTAPSMPATPPRPPTSTPSAGPTIPAVTPPGSPSLAEYLKPSKKPPIPSAESITAKMKTVRDLYYEDYTQAKTRDEKVAVADQMRETANETQNDPEGQFALYRVARDIFIRENDFASALEIVDLMEDSFADVDGLRLKRDVLEGVEKPLAGSAEFSIVSMGLAEDCLKAGRIDDGIAICETLQQTVKRIPQPHTVKFKELQQQLSEAKSLLERYQRSAMTLEETPDDPAAQSIAGKFLCLVEARWDDALPRLAEGSDQLYRDAAKSELAIGTNGVSELEVADLWFEIIENSDSSFEKRALADHAMAYYQSARVKTGGLEARKIDQRLLTLNLYSSPGPLSAARIRSEQREAAARSKLSAKQRALAAKPKVIQSRTYDSGASSDFATFRGNTIQIGMGSHSAGTGEAAAGVEFANVGTVAIRGAASHPVMTTSSSTSKVGFVIDYHTPGGYTKRVFLNCSTNTPSLFYSNPPWGTARAPDDRDFLPVSPQYTIDLEEWAPNNWDGRCWFSVYMQNAGLNRMLTATLSWTARSSDSDAE